jgi:hypothetical protein
MPDVANVLTSRTDAVADGVVTHQVGGSKEGVQCYLKYSRGSGSDLTIQFSFICGGISATDQYLPIYMATGIPTVMTHTFTTSGNYRIPVPLARCETVVAATVTFGTATKSATAVVDFRNE